MNPTIDNVVALIEDTTAKYHTEAPSNTSALNLEVVHGFQLLFGVANPDPMANGVEHYKSWIKNKIHPIVGSEILVWGFDDEQLLTVTLNALSTNYNANLNVTRIMRDIKIEKDSLVYLAVTIVEIPIVISR